MKEQRLKTKENKEEKNKKSWMKGLKSFEQQQKQLQ